MKKTLAALLLCLLFVSPPTFRSAPKKLRPPKSDRESRNLVGPVETVRYEWCTLSDEPDESGKCKEVNRHFVQTVTFDIDGRIVKQDPPPYVCGTSLMIEASQKHNRTYDRNGNEIEDIVTDLKGRVKHRVVQAFDAAGNRTEVAYYFPDGTLNFKWLSRFDENGNEVEIVGYGKGGIFESKELRAYNERGQCVEYTRFNRNGSADVTRRIEFEYDAYGNSVKSIEYELVTKDGSSFFKPERADYRLLTYFTER